MAIRAIIVLGVPLQKGGGVNPICVARIRRCMGLFGSGGYGFVVFSGKWWFRLKKRPEKTEARGMRDYALTLGLPKGRTVLEEHSRDTFENAYFSKRMLMRRGCREFTLITSDYQVPRARYIFETVFGNRYKMALIGVRSDLRGRELSIMQSGERVSLQIFKSGLGREVKPGDDRSIRRLMMKRRLAYAGKIEYEPEVKELIKKLTALRERSRAFLPKGAT